MTRLVVPVQTALQPNVLFPVLDEVGVVRD